MMGCSVLWKCLVACLFFEESQQPTWPQIMQSRRCTHVSPILRQSSQPLLCGVTGLISLTCSQPFMTSLSRRPVPPFLDNRKHRGLTFFPAVRPSHIAQAMVTAGISLPTIYADIQGCA